MKTIKISRAVTVFLDVTYQINSISAIFISGAAFFLEQSEGAPHFSIDLDFQTDSSSTGLHLTFK